MSPDVKILYYCLDPTYPGMDHLLNLPIDGFLVNSEFLFESLRPFYPTLLLPLGFNPTLFSPQFDPKYAHSVVYVGAGGPMLGMKVHLREMLEEAVPFNLAIYGSGWESSQTFAECCWKGILPQDDLSKVYSSSQVILSATIDSQREMGMVNNRLFEALSLGKATVISDEIKDENFVNQTLQMAVEERKLLFYKEKGDVTRYLSEIYKKGEFEESIHSSSFAQSMISNHSYSARMTELIPFLNSFGNITPISIEIGVLMVQDNREIRKSDILIKLFQTFNDFFHSPIHFSFHLLSKQDLVQNSLNKVKSMLDGSIDGRNFDGWVVVCDKLGDELDLLVRKLVHIRTSKELNPYSPIEDEDIVPSNRYQSTPLSIFPLDQDSEVEESEGGVRVWDVYKMMWRLSSNPQDVFVNHPTNHFQTIPSLFDAFTLQQDKQSLNDEEEEEEYLKNLLLDKESGGIGQRFVYGLIRLLVMGNPLNSQIQLLPHLTQPQQQKFSFQLSYHLYNFVIGVDGSVCVNYHHKKYDGSELDLEIKEPFLSPDFTIKESLMCIHQSNIPLSISINTPSHNPNQGNFEIYLSLELRSTVFDDPIVSSKIIPFQIEEWNSNDLIKIEIIRN